MVSKNSTDTKWKILEDKSSKGLAFSMMSSIVGLGASIFAPKILSYFRDQKIQIVHAMPGRIRLQCDRWKNETVATTLETALTNVSIVRSVTASSVTGTLLIEFHVPHITQQELDQLLQFTVETVVSAYPHMEPQIMNTMRQAVQTVDGQIKKRTSAKADLDSIIVLLLLGKGVLGYSKNRAFSSSLLFWAYSILTNRKDIKHDRDRQSPTYPSRQDKIENQN